MSIVISSSNSRKSFEPVSFMRIKVTLCWIRGWSIVTASMMRLLPLPYLSNSLLTRISWRPPSNPVLKKNIDNSLSQTQADNPFAKRSASVACLIRQCNECHITLIAECRGYLCSGCRPDSDAITHWMPSQRFESAPLHELLFRQWEDNRTVQAVNGFRNRWLGLFFR